MFFSISMFSLGSLSIPIPPKKPNQRLCGYQVQLCTQVQYYSVLVQVRGYHAFLIFILPLYVHCGFIVRVLRYFNTWLDCSLITLLLAEYVIAFSLVVKIFLLVFVTPEWIALYIYISNSCSYMVYATNSYWHA